MIINKLGIENFKGIRSAVSFDFAPTTLLFGPNSAGKSTILHAFNVLNDAINHRELDSDTTHLGRGGMNLGGFRQYVNDHDLNKTVVLTLGLDLQDEDLSETNAARDYVQFYNSLEASSINGENSRERLIDMGEVSEKVNQAEFKVSIAWSEYKNRPYAKSFDLDINGGRLLSISSTHSMTGATIHHFNIEHPVLKDDNSGESHLGHLIDNVIDEQFLSAPASAFIGVEQTTDALLSWDKDIALSEIWALPFHARQHEEILFKGVLHTLLLGVLEVAGKELSKAKYIGPLRKVPQRNFVFSRTKQSSWANGLAAWDTLAHRGSKFVSQVNDWLASDSRLNSGYELHLESNLLVSLQSRLMALLEGSELNGNRDEINRELKKLPLSERVGLRDIRRNIAVQPLDVGAGISQVVPIIVGALEPSISMLLAEQPELHIHPKLQVELAELFIEASLTGQKSFLLETHSEHIILRYLRKIRDKEIAPSSVIVYYIDTVKDETKVRKIRIDEDGEFIDRWPRGGFFPERARELF